MLPLNVGTQNYRRKENEKLKTEKKKIGKFRIASRPQQNKQKQKHPDKTKSGARKVSEESCLYLILRI